MRRLVMAMLFASACGGSSSRQQEQASYTVPNEPATVDVSGAWTGIALGASYAVTMDLAQVGAQVSGDCRFRYHASTPLFISSGRVGASTLGAACTAAPWAMETCAAGSAFTIEGFVEVAPAFDCVNCNGRFTGVWRCGTASGQFVMYRDVQPWQP